MSVKVNSADELGDALGRKEDEIEIEGKLGDAVIRIRAVGKVAWAIAIGAIGVAIASVILASATQVAPPAAPGAAIAGLASAPVLLSTFGSLSVAKIAVTVAIAGGGIGSLTAMRKYSLRKCNNKVILYRND